MRNLHIVFHCDCNNLHSHQQCTMVSFSPQPWQHLLFIIFFLIAILTGVRWYLIVFLIYISMMIGDVEHLFQVPVVDICMSSWKNDYSDHLPIFNQIFCYWILYIFWILTLTIYMICKYFLPVHRLSFHFKIGRASCRERV